MTDSAQGYPAKSEPHRMDSGSAADSCKLSRAFAKLAVKRQSISSRIAEVRTSIASDKASIVEPFLDQLDDAAYIIADLKPKSVADLKMKVEILLEYLDENDDLPGMLTRQLCHDLLRMQMTWPVAFATR